jgi:glycosyltransferase involved in cell wall biosynthesis
MARAQELGLSNVKFLPPVPKTDMPEALAAADACIAILKPIPLYSTVYPNKVFDYLAAGRPVVLAMEGVIREVVEEAEAGIAIAPGDSKALADAIITLADNPNKCAAMGRLGHLYVKSNFDRPFQAQRLIDLIEHLAIRQ